MLDASETIPRKLREFFEQNPRPALAFSGGADSSYLLYAAVQCGADVTPYVIKSQFQPMTELEHAEKTAAQMNLELHIILVNLLSDSKIRKNTSERCYYCKKVIFEHIIEQAKADKKKIIIDATNASDDPSGRPGMKALEELGIVSPLRICGITKQEVRELSRKAGLWTWDLPSNSCLATRIPAGMQITEEDLLKVEDSEDSLHELGFRDLRVRITENGARLETTEKESEILENNKPEVEKILSAHFGNISYSAREAGL